MNAGNFDKRITFQKLNENTKDESGFSLSDDQKWLDYKTVWAMIKTLSSREFYQAGSTQAETNIRFVIRYRTDITSAMRIKYKGRIFDIVAPPINDDEKNITLTIHAKEVI